MTKKKPWQIWFKDTDGTWSVVAGGFDQREGRLEASRRNSARRRNGASGPDRYRAMPIDVVPYYDEAS